MHNKCLIVNADDYGLTKSVSEGIRLGFVNGIITSTSVIAKNSSIDEDLELLRQQCSRIGIGVHLFITSFNPVTQRNKIKSLLKDGEKFYSFKELKKVSYHFNVSEIYCEWKNQIETLLRKKISIDHIDSHHHVCFLNKKTVDVTIQLAKEYKLSVRTPFSLTPSPNVLNYAKQGFIEKGILSPGNLIVDFTNLNGDLEILKKNIVSLPQGFTELVTHAGKVDNELISLSSLVYTRETELYNLLNPMWKKTLEEQNIRLTTFREFNNQVVG